MSEKVGYRSFIDVDAIPEVSVSNGQCAGFVMHYTRVGVAARWKQGPAVRGNRDLKKGTAIATFLNGRYPNVKHGNHAALYVGQDATGIWVIDQWEGRNPRKRHIPFLGGKEGAWIDPSNNGDAFSVIEL